MKKNIYSISVCVCLFLSACSHSVAPESIGKVVSIKLETHFLSTGGTSFITVTADTIKVVEYSLGTIWNDSTAYYKGILDTILTTFDLAEVWSIDREDNNPIQILSITTQSMATDSATSITHSTKVLRYDGDRPGAIDKLIKKLSVESLKLRKP